MNQPSPLRNKGNICYLNSAFQSISGCKTFVKELNDLNVKYKYNVEKLQVFLDLIEVLNNGSKNPQKICNNAIFNQWNKRGQQDCYELLAYVLNEVYNDLRSFKDDWRDYDRWLKERLPMRFIFQYEITCGCKEQTKSPLQSDLALHVAIPMDEKMCDLTKLLDLYFAKEIIDDFICEKKDCNGKGAGKTTKFIEPLPHTICIHLQRKCWNGTKMKIINKKVKFYPKLELKSTFLTAKEQISAKDESYDLVSVIQHSKTILGGHYISYKKVEGKWFLTNDSSVYEVPETDVLNCKAYMLFFEQIP